MFPSEEQVRVAATAIMVANGCGLTRDGELVFCDHCDCETSARAALETLCTPPVEELSGALAELDHTWPECLDPNAAHNRRQSRSEA